MEDRITVNGQTYVAEKAAGEAMRIVIVDKSGLTFVGRCDLSGDNEQIVIHDARCIIQWGTSKHLAELVNGPTKTTQLGATADVTVFRHNLVAAYDTDSEAWSC
jgi:hypothetical protein